MRARADGERQRRGRMNVRGDSVWSRGGVPRRRLREPALPGGLRSALPALHSRRFDAVMLYAFDLLELDGEDLRRRPLAERKAMLEQPAAPRAASGSALTMADGRQMAVASY
jgi:hypothetical protein